MTPEKSGLLDIIMTHDLTRGFAIGALGGVVRWLTLRHTWQEGLVTIIVGGICAMYLGPLAIPILEPFIETIAPAGDPGGLSSFLIGMGGISISGLILDIFDRRRRDVDKGGDDA